MAFMLWRYAEQDRTRWGGLRYDMPYWTLFPRDAQCAINAAYTVMYVQHSVKVVDFSLFSENLQFELNFEEMYSWTWRPESTNNIECTAFDENLWLFLR